MVAAVDLKQLLVTAANKQLKGNDWYSQGLAKPVQGQCNQSKQWKDKIFTTRSQQTAFITKVK